MYIYLFLITVSLAGVYVGLFWLLPFFFAEPRPAGSRISLLSVLSIIALSLAGYVGVELIPDPELGNRFQHFYGGGVMGFLVCWLAARDLRLSVSRGRFWFLALLLVTALGVANEIVEFLLHNYFGLVSATSINDTWLDLVNNTLGILAASAVLLPFYSRYKASEVLYRP